MSQVVHLQQIYEKYKDRVACFFVYQREAHIDTLQAMMSDGKDDAAPEDAPLADIVEMPTELSPEKQKAAATKFQKTMLTMPVLLDRGKVEKLYKGWPSRMVFISRSGRILWNFGLINEEGQQTMSGSYDLPATDRWIKEYLAIQEKIAQNRSPMN